MATGTAPVLAALCMAATASGDGTAQAGHTAVEAIELRQRASPAPTASPAPLENIVVTARKHPESVDRIPSSVTALDPTEMARRGDAALRDYLLQVPGVGLTELQPDYFRVAIRGMQTSAAGNTTQATGFFIDDVPFNDPFLAEARPDVYPFDLESIEVLKGPQGTLFGGSALAGAIRYSPVGARLGEWQLKTFAQLDAVADGAPNQFTGLAVNLPVFGDTTGLRLVGVRQDHGGVIDDLRNGKADTDRSRGYDTRGLFRWEAGPKLAIALKTIQQRRDSEDVPLAETTNGRLERERALRASPSNTSFDLYGLEIDFAAGPINVFSSTSFLSKYGALSNANGARSLGIEALGQPVGLPSTGDIEGLMQEFRLSSPGHGADRWIVGLVGYRYDSLNSQQAIAEAGPTGLPVELLNFFADVSAQELAVFGELTRAFAKNWELTTGARLYEVASQGTVMNSGALILTSGSLQNSNDASIRSRGVNPKLALRYLLSEELSVYGSASRGFRFGGIQIVGPTALMPDVPQTYEPDSVWSYELGFKGRWLGRTLRMAGAIFYNDWQDPQVQTTSGGPVPFNVIDNVGAARSVGAEWELQARLPIAGLELSAGAAITDARTTEVFTAPGGDVVEPGAKLPGQPDRQLMAGIRSTTRWRHADLIAGIDYTYQGEGVSDILQSMAVYDYSTLGAMISLSFPALPGAPSATLGVRNLTDRRAVASAFVESEDNFTTVYNRPRTSYLRVSWNFN